MSKQFSRFMQHRGRRKKSDTAELAAQLAPLEEQDQEAAAQQGAAIDHSGNGRKTHEPGTIVVDTGSLVLPKGVTETEERALGSIEPVVLVIVGLMLAFIAFIAWQVSQMPAQ